MARGNRPGPIHVASGSAPRLAARTTARVRRPRIRPQQVERADFAGETAAEQRNPRIANSRADGQGQAGPSRLSHVYRVGPADQQRQSDQRADERQHAAPLESFAEQTGAADRDQDRRQPEGE